jgi:hypothetical protein
MTPRYSPISTPNSTAWRSAVSRINETLIRPRYRSDVMAIPLSRLRRVADRRRPKSAHRARGNRGPRHGLLIRGSFERDPVGEQMTCWPISARVGNVTNNDPSLIEAIAVQ